MHRDGVNRDRPPARPPWARLPDDQLLDLRICDLGLSLDGSGLERRVRQLHEELDRRHLRFKPRCWLSDEWFSPDDVPGIAIPFYLAHQRLRKLEDRTMLEVEGGTKRWCMQLLRHEAGHAFEVAYRLGRRPRWRKMFGAASKPYPDQYRPKPFSRKYVLHLDWWYAQSHPCEDFAETFAVWLRPQSQWRRHYRGWPALKKLEYVDELMAEIGSKAPALRSRSTVEPVSKLRHTLREHYRRKQERYGKDYPDFYDRDLRRLFSDAPDHRDMPRASIFLRRISPDLRAIVADWTGEHAYTVNMLLKEMISRCRQLDLRVSAPPDEVKVEAAVMLTMQTTNYLHSPGHRVVI